MCDPDGEIASAESFTLEDPDRLVIDLEGLMSEVSTERVDVGSPHVDRVRLGGTIDLTSLAFFRPDGIPTIVVSFFADYSDGDVVLNDELSEFAWVTLEEAREYEFIEGIFEELEMLDRHLETGDAVVWGQVEIC